MHALKFHNECIQFFVEFCNVVCTVHEQIGVMYKDELQNHCKNTFEYVQIINDLVA